MTQAGLLDQRRLAARAYWSKTCAAARADVNVFCESAFRNDQDPNAPPFKQQWFHREWQRAWEHERTSVLHGAVGFGKTDQSIARHIWKIGNDPNRRVLLLGKQQENAKRNLRKIKRQIEENQIIRSIFPELRPGFVWNDERLRVAKASIQNTTDTITTVGLDGSPAGLRADEIDADDVIDLENTLTEHQRNKTIELFDSVIQGRLTTDGQLRIEANAWHPEDLAFTYARRPGVWHGVYPAISKSNELLWPEFRTRAWLEEKRGTMGDAQFARMYLCEPTDESSRLFKAEWFQRARAAGLGAAPRESYTPHFDADWQLINPADVIDASRFYEAELRIVIGVDLATGETEKKRKTDFTCFFVLGVDGQGRRHVLWIEKGRWDAGESVRRLAKLQRRYQPAKFLVETNGTQKFFLDYAREFNNFGASIEPFTTTGEKWSASVGIEAIGAELQAGRWVIPNPTNRAALSPQELEALDHIDEWAAHLLDFSRAGHTPDDVMSSWFAQRGAVRLSQAVFRDERPQAPAWNPLATWDRTQGNAATAQALEGLAAQAAGVDPDIEIPDHIARSFGLR